MPENNLTSAQLIAQAQKRIGNTFMDLLGIRIIEISHERAVAEMSFSNDLRQLTGLFHAGALITLADTTATFFCMHFINGRVECSEDEVFPLTIQLSSNLIRNSDSGVVKAEAAPVHKGRTSMVIETRVTDSRERLLAKVTTTQLVLR